MALPFVPNNHKRKWQCFVCGMLFEEFESFKKHILETHDEGRDFVVCPLKRCGAPVRDLKSHFKVKHPRENLPKGVQMKAIIWRDRKVNKKGKLVTRKPKFNEGHVISRKMNGKEIHYRSGYEREVYGLLESLNEVVEYDTETVEIPYSFNGRQHKYLPDLQIIFANGTVELWEIKPATQTNHPRNLAKWDAARYYCNVRGWKFNVVTEVGIGKLRREIKQRSLNGRL